MLIIFSGYNQRAVIAFLRTLHKNHVDHYGIIAASEEDTILHTVYAKNVAYVRKKKQLCLEEICFAINLVYDIYKEKSCIIVPSTEALNRFLLKNRNFLEKQGCCIPLVSEKLYESVSDKEEFWKICHKNGLCVPRLIKLKKNYSQPFVAKPKKYFASNGNVYSPVIVKTEKDFAEFKEKYSEIDFDYQEYVNGTSYYLLFYFSKKGMVYKFSQENYVQQPGGKSIIAAGCSTIHLDEAITQDYENLFLNLAFTGFVMVELRKSENNFYMIEANPRFWGPSQLFCDAGYNLFEVFLYEYGIISQIPERKINNKVKYFWSGGLKGLLMEDEDCMWLGNGKNKVKENLNAFLESDIYKRNDTLNIFYQESRNKDGEKF